MKLTPEKNSGLNGIRTHEFLVHNFDDLSCLHLFLRGVSSVRIQDRPYIHLHSFTFYGCITNSQSDQLPDALIAQSVEHCIGIAEIMGSNPFRPEFFSGLNITTAQVVCITAMINN